MAVIGIDVGKRQHIAAVHHDGEREARKAVLRFGADRQGLAELTTGSRGRARSRVRTSNRVATTT